MSTTDRPRTRSDRPAVARTARRIVTALVGSAVLAVVALPLSGSAEAAPKTKAEAAAYAITLPVTLARQAQDQPLRVASYNVRCANCYDGAKNEKRWADRRGAVVEAILAQDLDVIGVQEVSQGQLKGSKMSQFDDLLNRLGGPWKITNAKRYNCVNHMSPNNCRYEYQGASLNNRIFYNSDRIELVAQGSKKLPAASGKGDNFMAWAQFRQLSTGAEFMFSDIHTASEDKFYKVKKRQAAAAAAELKAQNPGNLAMIAVGDWNSSRFEKPSNGPYDAYVQAGFVDPLGGKYRTTKSAPGATVENRIRTWVDSSNRWTRKAPAHRGWINGSYIDYIMTTKMRVSEWETVAKLDSKGNFIGTIPSDHNMIRATVWLP